MKITTKILLSLMIIVVGMLVPSAFSVLNIWMPIILRTFLIIWAVEFLIYIWRLPSYQKLIITGSKDDKWGIHNDVIGLKSELIKHLNPQQFLYRNYNKASVAFDMAIELSKIDANDILKLSAIRIQAQNELGITIDPVVFRDHLLEVFSPLKYKKPEYVHEMFRICNDILECYDDMVLMEKAIINALQRIAHWNSLAPSCKTKITKKFLWGIIGYIALYTLYITIISL